jgi:hypothetical protein
MEAVISLTAKSVATASEGAAVSVEVSVSLTVSGFAGVVQALSIKSARIRNTTARVMVGMTLSRNFGEL